MHGGARCTVAGAPAFKSNAIAGISVAKFRNDAALVAAVDTRSISRGHGSRSGTGTSSMRLSRKCPLCPKRGWVEVAGIIRCA